ncbi:MAG: hypothetical protein MUF36_01095 [Bacteroidales bacterium]|jgi:hypothetical protein|nr:hypothetical protein [Bacteroidales bacterium]
MKLKPYHIIIYTLLLFLSLKADGQSKEISSVLVNLYDRILFTGSDEEKVKLNDSILLVIDGYAASDSVFSHKFTNLRFLGQITSSDSRIKIITWNLLLRNGINNYYCYIIRKGKKSQGNRIYKLMGGHKPEQAETGRVYSADDWYGALYYAIEPCKKEYVILGLDFGGMMVSRKIIDVLSFTPDGRLVLGKDIFLRENKKRFREVLEYSSESVVSLRFNSPKMLIFDHLASFSTGEGDDESMGTGLSYDGYDYKKGTWYFITNVDARNPKK